MLKIRKFIPMTYEQIGHCKGIGVSTVQSINKAKNYSVYVKGLRSKKKKVKSLDKVYEALSWAIIGATFMMIILYVLSVI